ncbi:class I SAM-dependent methyltransferase [Rhizobium sp. GN54]|uniref:class I SAM-dependent methyltransferase n=1 Tax=Rhizobium sp. GN54 TaxID=2898150 RepID=UPI001E35DE54|nr:class I SAM-dependent methyltransferase [Rhizobium sp. GN54]MCD2181671.1 class I SAM-dependent methyltransferase [Rhizobium sp. GN54]
MATIGSRTSSIASDWKSNSYYLAAEQERWVDVFWNAATPFRRLFDHLDVRKVVDLACGHGRQSARMLSLESVAPAIEKVYLLDVNQENIDACTERFRNSANNSRIEMKKISGADFRPLEDSSITAIFCYDAMVHFEYDAVLSYINDAARILQPGGRALFHHSNFVSAPGADYKENPHWRNYMSKSLFAHAANRAGLSVLDQVTIEWDGERNLDCLSLLERPKDTDRIQTARRERNRDLYGKIRRKLMSLRR